MFNELINKITVDIKTKEGRSRSMPTNENIAFKHAVTHLLKDLWKAFKSIPVRECLINCKSGYYSENSRYRDPNLNYQQMEAAFNGLIKLGLIEITKSGSLGQKEVKGDVTRFIATDELIDRFKSLRGHPAIILTPDLSKETIILGNTINGHKEAIDYKDTPKTEDYRDNLRMINQRLIRHWADLKIKDSEIPILENRISNHKTKESLDLSERTLVRIFSNGSFKQGGHFYGGWWQNIPSEYRKHITLDGNQTCEYDYSQLNPHIIYFAYNKDLGSEDAYDRVLDGKHRDIVRKAFNAMIQASNPLKRCPKDIILDQLEMSWAELRDRILEAHKPIRHLFFTGIGMELQFENSKIAENIMLQFYELNEPTLSVHDSFILYPGYGYTGGLEEIIRRAFFDSFSSDIPISREVIQFEPANDVPPKLLDIKSTFKVEEEYSVWQENDSLWRGES